MAPNHGTIEAPSDADLVRRARGEDGEAFGVLFDRWFDRCWNLARTVVRQEDLAAEVAQDAMLAAWQRLDQLDDPEAFGGWLLRITRNRALNRLEREQRTRAAGDDVVSGLKDRGLPDPVGAAATPGVETIGEVRDRQELVWAAAAALGERDASLLDLHLRHGLEPAEIAEELGVAPNAAHQQLFKLRNRLGEAIGSYLLWRNGRPLCEGLAAAVSGDIAFDRPVARAVAKHQKTCDECSERRASLVSPGKLFAAVPLVGAPAHFKVQAAAALAEAGVPIDPASLPGTDAGSANDGADAVDPATPDTGGPTGAEPNHGPTNGPTGHGDPNHGPANGPSGHGAGVGDGVHAPLPGHGGPPPPALQPVGSAFTAATASHHDAGDTPHEPMFHLGPAVDPPGTPPIEPALAGSAGRRRRPLLAAAATGVAVLLIGLLLWRTAGGDGDGPGVALQSQPAGPTAASEGGDGDDGGSGQGRLDPDRSTGEAGPAADESAEPDAPIAAGPDDVGDTGDDGTTEDGTTTTEPATTTTVDDPVTTTPSSDPTTTTEPATTTTTEPETTTTTERPDPTTTTAPPDTTTTTVRDTTTTTERPDPTTTTTTEKPDTTTTVPPPPPEILRFIVRVPFEAARCSTRNERRYEAVWATERTTEVELRVPGATLTGPPSGVHRFCAVPGRAIGLTATGPGGTASADIVLS